MINLENPLLYGGLSRIGGFLRYYENMADESGADTAMDTSRRTAADRRLVERPVDAQALRTAMARAPVTLLTGPRQAGKSTLVRSVVSPSPSSVFDLEDYRDLARLVEPMLALRDTGSTIVIDEAQRMPELFTSLRVLVDENRRPGRFVVLGSASPDLTASARSRWRDGWRWWSCRGSGSATSARTVSTTCGCAARCRSRSLPQTIRHRALGVTTTSRPSWNETWPASDSVSRRRRRFWTMLAHYHGQTWNGAAIARSIDVSETTVRRLVDALTEALVVRQLPA